MSKLESNLKEMKYSFIGPLSGCEKQLMGEVCASINLLLKWAENNPECLDIDTGLAEITISGTEYQIQVSFVANKKKWCSDGYTRFSELVKIHK